MTNALASTALAEITVLQVHQNWAWFVIISNGLAGLWALIANWRFQRTIADEGDSAWTDALPGSVVGLKAPLSCLTQARYGITWGVIGAAQACLTEALEYSKTRILFNRPLAATQTIQIRLAEMARGITLAQLLSLQLGRLKDSGKLQPVQVSLAKWHNCRMALDVARDCRDMLGASGISAEFAPIRHMLNLESVITYEGTETVHQLAVGRQLTGHSAY